jgi:hypothetical protein
MLAESTTTLDVSDQLDRYPLLDALLHRRSRRFGLGMKMEHGPFAYTSRHAPRPLTEDEEAALAFAACGLTGYALADLAYARGQGGQMIAGMLGRTIGSGDAINGVSVVVTNDEATYLLKRPQDFAPAEYRELVQLAQAGELTELYRRSRIKIADGRTAPSTKPGYNFNVNKWSLYAAGSSYLLPINEITALYINALLEAFEPEMGYFVVDERNNLQPAGIGRFAKSKGGHLDDSLADERVGTIQFIETALIEALAVEQGMVLQNVALMAQALGLGGFPHFAKHEYSWLQALNFRTESIPATRYLGASGLVSLAARLTGREQSVPLAVGLERNGLVLLKPYSPPYFPNMAEAVRAFVAYKFGPQGIFRGGAAHSGWREPGRVAAAIPAPSEAAIAATIAYCEYVYQRYGRFPAYSPPFRTMLGYQATHVDVEFYDRFYRPEALSDTQRAAWARNRSA